MTFPGFNLHRWAAVLANRVATDSQDQDSAVEAAAALVEVLDSAHLERFADALLEATPGLRERFTRALLEELCEEIVRREESEYSHATVKLIQEIENDWGQEQ